VRGLVIAAVIAAATATSVYAQGDDGGFSGLPEHPAIDYQKCTPADAVARLSAKIAAGSVPLKYQGASGYLRSVLEALDVPVESQIAVFARNSLQKRIISPERPRTIFFNDSVTVGWVPGEPFVEIAAQDARQGVMFYTLEQSSRVAPHFVRQDQMCLICHESYSTLRVPGVMVRSVFPSPDGTPIRPLGDVLVDHRTPFARRWGGWFVTGRTDLLGHSGNTVWNGESSAESVTPPLSDGRYLSPHSDMVALTVFEHQMRMMNLLTVTGWEFRLAEYEHRPSHELLTARVNELVDYMLFVDEARLSSRVAGTSGFTETFAAKGPFDRRGRSLRQFDLEHRLLRYPCSYMIYSEAFDALPATAKDAIYRRMWTVLTTDDAKYTRLTASDRRNIVEILRDTRPDLPAFFQRK
jgi:hypothetical protein